MARNLSQIYDSIITEKTNQVALSGLEPNIDNVQDLLSDLTSKSKVADWRIWTFLIAFAIWVHEGLWEIFKSEVEIIIAAAIPGGLEWYKQECLNFQYGDSLFFINNKWQYLAIDETKKIIKFAAVIEVAGDLYLKVAKDNNGVPEQLSALELASFNAYMKKKKFAGTYLFIISRVADNLKLMYNIFYDPLILTPTGELIATPGVKPVEIAITTHLSQLPFNGALNLTKLTDNIQTATGVVDPVLISAQAKYGLIPYTEIDVEYLPDAGYLVIDDNFPLNLTINYIPKL